MAIRRFNHLEEGAYSLLKGAYQWSEIGRIAIINPHNGPLLGGGIEGLNAEPKRSVP